jgi:hypothetical protein
MLPSTMLNLLRWTLTPQCPEIILETVFISFVSALHSSNHGLRETLVKMECENLPVSATFQLLCHSSSILCYAAGSKSRETDRALYTIAQSSLTRFIISLFISRNSNMCGYPHETHFTVTSFQLPAFLFTLVHERMGMQQDFS